MFLNCREGKQCVSTYKPNKRKQALVSTPSSGTRLQMSFAGVVLRQGLQSTLLPLTIRGRSWIVRRVSWWGVAAMSTNKQTKSQSPQLKVLEVLKILQSFWVCFGHYVSFLFISVTVTSLCKRTSPNPLWECPRAPRIAWNMAVVIWSLHIGSITKNLRGSDRLIYEDLRGLALACDSSLVGNHSAAPRVPRKTGLSERPGAGPIYYTHWAFLKKPRFKNSGKTLPFREIPVKL